MLGGAYFGYKYVTSPQLKNRVMNEVLLKRPTDDAKNP